MKSILFFLAFLMLAAPMSRGDSFTDEITAGMKIIWAVQTNVWPPTNKIWSYKVIPQHFSDVAISNLMTSLGTKNLNINLASGCINYQDEKAIASMVSSITNVPEPVVGVPSRKETYQLGLKYLRLAGIDISQLAVKPDGKLKTTFWLGTRGWWDTNHNFINETNSWGVDFYRRIDGIDTIGGSAAFFEFGNNAKVSDLQISWRNLEPHQLLDHFVTPEQIVQSIQNGKTPFLPRIRTAWRFGKVKTLTITDAEPCYEMKPAGDTMNFVTPVLQLSAVMNNGTTNWPISFRRSIFPP
ncbi:MAG: hypothetical protein ACREFE_18520 [Limisphaerales bacterium]